MKVSKDVENGYILGIKTALMYFDNYIDDYYKISENMLNSFHEIYTVADGLDVSYEPIKITNDINKEKEIVVSFFNELLDLYEFNLVVNIKDNFFQLKDLQMDNYGLLKNEKFYNLGAIMNRLELWHRDYIYRSLEERESENEEILLSDWDLNAKRYIENPIVSKMLDKITVKEYSQIKSDKDYQIEDVISLLNELEEKNPRLITTSKVINNLYDSLYQEFYNLGGCGAYDKYDKGWDDAIEACINSSNQVFNSIKASYYLDSLDSESEDENDFCM